jgi:hypothetical protein
MSADVDALQASIESLDRDGRLLALMEKLNRSHTDEIRAMHEELAELRDGLLALSNRIESVTRAVCVPRGGLHSVPS